MQFLEFRSLAGPNVYTYRPVVVGRLDLGDYADATTNTLPGFAVRLCEILPGIAEHHCGLGHPGGFLERLREGTLLGHVIEHVAIELSQLAGIPVNHGKTRFSGDPGIYLVVIESRCDVVTELLLRSALEAVESVIRNRPFALDERIKEARELLEEADLGPSTRAIVEAAERRNIPHRRLDNRSLVQLGWGAKRKLIAASITSNTPCIAVDIAADKQLTKRMLTAACIPTPGGGIARSLDEALHLFRELGGPVAVKPHNGQQGKAVTLRVQNEEMLTAAFERARSSSPHVVIEPMLEGNDYRVLVVNGQVVAASRRIPATVVGDGVNTIAQLIERENAREVRGPGHARPLTRISVDEELKLTLSRGGLSLESIPAAGERIRVRDTANLSTGGEAVDVTASVHPDVARVCARAARVIGLDICGVDLVAGGIDRPLREHEGIVELNAAPGLRMHQSPSEGQARDVGEAIVQSLFPGNRDGRIPLVAVTGTNGKTTVTRMIAHVLNFCGNNVGMTTTDGIYVNNQCIAEGDMTGPHSAWTVLSDPSVDCAVLETARGGILRRGLGFDWADVGVLTNIQIDHLGQDGLESEEDLLWVKSLVAERVRVGGAIVLNADDERLLTLPERRKVDAARKHIVYFTLSEPQGIVSRHLIQGGRAFFVRDGWLMEAENHSEHYLMRIADLSITIDGLAEFQVANVLAAAAACRALDVPRQTIASALRTFESCHNAGRANLFRAGAAFVMLDYGHNPGAFAAVCRMAERWKGHRTIGVVGVPGDRNDEVIRCAGRMAAKGFDRILIKEDLDLRGRRSGEVPGLLRQGILEEAPGADAQIILDEREAVQAALAELRPGELLIVFHEHAKPILELLRQRGAVAVSGFDQMPGREPVLWEAGQHLPQFGD